MAFDDWVFKGRSGLTRVSVVGTHDGYLVRTGEEGARLVRKVCGRLVCECGAAGCAHAEAVVLCGFVDEAAGQQKAA
jgi:hypothetical protein